MNLLRIAIVAGVLVFVSFNNLPAQKRPKKNTQTSDTITTRSGLKYIITQSNPTGKQPKAGDRVVVHYTGKLINDTIFDSSYKRGQPISFVLGKGQVIKGWDEGIALLKTGEKATLRIPPELGYGERSIGKIPANATLIFEVELLEVHEKVTPKPFEVTNKDTLKTPSGLKYIIVEKGNGPPTIPNKMVKVHYTGYLTDGKMFDSSVERGQPFEFMLGVGQVIKGWDEGIQLLNIGSKARLLIPYSLAYGEKGFPPVIPPKSDLIFDVEILSQGP